MMKVEHLRKNSTSLNRMAGRLVLSKRTVFLFWMCVMEARSPSTRRESCWHHPESLHRVKTYPSKPALPIGICQTRSSIKYSMSINLLKYTYLYVLRYVFHGTRLLVSVIKNFLIVFFLSVHITILMKLAWLYQVKKKKNYDNCIACMIHTQE